MNRKLNLIAFAMTLLAAAARGDDLADKGRDIFNKNQHAVVTVQVVLKAPDSTGRSSSPTESKMDVTGTVIDPSGLTVLALSSADPGELYRKISDRFAKYETEVTDVKLLLDDGTEVPSEIVLRDKDLDLAFVRPKTKPASPMAAVDLSKSSVAQMMEPVIALNRLNRAAGRAYSACVERIGAVIQKPRTFYIPDTNPSTRSLGSPAFALNGNIVGIFVMRAVSAGESVGRSLAENVMPILIPAEDILKGAKQAPEAKPVADKPVADKPVEKPVEKDSK